MPRLAAPLTTTRVKNLKPKDRRHFVADGGGLVLEVMTSGAKIWRFRYRLHGKQQPLVTIGSYPAVSLQEARDRARRYAEVVAAGYSPATDAQRDRGAIPLANLVRDVAEQWYEAEIATKSKSYQIGTRRALAKDILPAIGNRPLQEVTPGDVLAICDAIKSRGSPQSALRARNVLKRLYEYAISRQLAKDNPAQQVVARYIATAKSRDRVLSPDEIGRLLRAVYVSNMSRAYKLAVHLLVLTMVRKSDLIEAEWNEVDFNESIWRIPGERMKKDKEHWVYLSAQALAMFRELQTLSSSKRFIFPMRRGYADRPIAKSTLNQSVRAMNLDLQHFVLHDFRRTASTHLHEMGHSPDAIEKALAHAIKGLRGVYNRAEYGDERRKILQLWADFVDAQIYGNGQVITGHFPQVAPLPSQASIPAGL